MDVFTEYAANHGMHAKDNAELILERLCSELNIVTHHEYPPIPIREFDWYAHYDGEEEAGNYGWGATEAEAVADFIENCMEDHDERMGK